MRLQRVRAVARKEWWHLLRDARSLGLMLLMPAMLLFLFGYAIRLDITEAPIGVVQESTDAISNETVARFDASRAFEVVARYRDRGALADALQAGRIWAGLVISYDYPRELRRHRARVQLLLDGTDANSARLMRNYASAIVDDLAREHGRQPPVRIEDRLWFNEGRESRLAILPGVIAVVMAVVGALMTSLTVAKEMELGNLIMLRTTPLTRREFLAGKLIPYFVIGMVDLAIAVAATVYLFDVPLRGSLLELGLVSALFLVVVMLQGALISITAGQQVLASQMALVSTFLPAFLLSGFIFAIENMPVVLQYLTLAVPARYYVALSKAIFLKGASPLLLWTQVIALAIIALLLGALVIKRARRLGLLE
ncbi:MAG: ABC transporter permease [Gammaproteobacteria bacterium]|nr:ABC transporter permease [Gammaproteobacteria bacterium]NIR83429.1 ABC transporter permease [Gammaproteobacteria bacterium]NIR91351.1 ABC transporter permease [Gammaproteobacteria bacterium]NIU04591.1 ABC transporter permease [Gammaproteobacteria bacterium]NIV51633.1 ABC transporter permease [Gammaproteobacteria bacterium]